MTTTPTIDATPATETVVYVIGNNIQEIINGFDEKMKDLELRREGDYIKMSRVWDTLLDLRNELSDLICPT